MRWLSRLTTVVVVVTVVVAVAMLIRSAVPDTEMGGSFKTYAKFRDASRLQVGSRVVIAGVRVGDITGLTIEGQFARVDMRLRGDIKLPVGTFATRKSDSLFGDSYIELIPGGSESDVLLKNGEPITNVQEGGSTDATLRAIARTMPKIDAALESMHELMLDGRRWVNGPMIERMNDADRWLAEGHIEGPLASADRAMEAFERGTTAAAEAVHETAPTLPKRLDDFDKSITNARKQMKEAKQGVQTALADARAGFDRIDPVIDDMAEITAAINEGRGDDWRGTLGRLVNDPSLGNTLDDFSGDAAEGAAGLNRFRSWIGGRTEVSVTTGEPRFYATGELHTRTDSFYLIEFSYSELGGPVSSTLSDSPGSGDFTRRQEIPDKFRFTAQYGKKLGFSRLRAGLKDSTPGIGADALFFNGRLKLSSDLYGAFDRAPRLKVAGALAVFRSIYILAGVDDVLNEPGTLPIVTGNTPVPEVFREVHYGRDYFLGASLQFSDADFSTFLRYYGALLAGYLLAR
jgi:phospholipid/cholesterol/gamma-HCH transport system substrate-binding protein